MNWKMTVLVIAVACMIVFVAQNPAVVQVQFLFWRLEASRALIYLSLFVIGALAGWLGSTMKRRR